MERTCEENAKVVRVAARWVFGHLLNHYFGNAGVILHQEAKDGSDITLSASDGWLVANHVSNLGVSQSDAAVITEHVSNCQTTCCVEAWTRLTKITQYVKRGQLPGGDPLALLSVFGGGVTFVDLSRGNGFDDAIDEYKHIAEWFETDIIPALTIPETPRPVIHPAIAVKVTKAPRKRKK